MPDIRDVLKGLSPDDRALYSEVRTVMRRAYLYAHSKVLPISQYEESDDQFLDWLDIKIAQLFDRSGTFNHSEGHLNTETTKIAEIAMENSTGTKMLKNGWPVSK